MISEKFTVNNKVKFGKVTLYFPVKKPVIFGEKSVNFANCFL